MAADDFPAPREGFVLTHFIVVEDIARSRDFCAGAAGRIAGAMAGPTMSLGPGEYRLRVRWRTDLPNDAAFARWLVLPPR